MKKEKIINKIKIKNKRKRKISIFTILIWVALVITMSSIVIQNIDKTSALENEEKRLITIKVDFSQYFEDCKYEDNIKEVYMRYLYIMRIKNINEEIIGNANFVKREDNIGIYELQITNEAYNIVYKEISNKYIIEGDEVKKIKDEYIQKIKSNKDVYEVKINTPSVRNITIEVDFSEYLEDEGIIDQDKKERQILYYLSFNKMYVYKTNNVTMKSQTSEISFKDRKIVENVAIFEAEIENDYKYIGYKSASKNSDFPYYIENEEKNIEHIYHSGNYLYYDKSAIYAEKITEGKSIYKVKLKRLEGLRNIIVKIDFSKYFENEQITKEMDKDNVVKHRYRYYEDYLDIIKDDDLIYDGINVCLNKKVVERQDNIGVYELQIMDGSEYLLYNSFNELYYIENADNSIEKVDERNYREKIIKDKDVYEVKLERREDNNRTITLKIDFGKFFEGEGENENRKKYIIERYHNFDDCIGIIEKNDEEKKLSENYTYRYIGYEGDIGIYELDITNNAEYIAYHKIPYNSYSTVPYGKYSIESNTNKIENISNYYCEKIDDIKNIYEVRLEKKEEERKRELTIKIDYSEYFENEGITEDEERNEFIEWRYGIDCLKTNYITSEYDIVRGFKKFKESENNIGTYTITISENDTKYLRFHYIGDMPYYLEVEGASDEYIYDSREKKSYCGIKIDADQSEYKVKLKKLDLRLYSSIKWEEDTKAKLEYKADMLSGYYSKITNKDYDGEMQCIVFIEKIDDNFKISDIYENDSTWLIVNEEDIVDDKWSDLEITPDGLDLKTDNYIPGYIPEYVFSKLFKPGNTGYPIMDKNIRYVYVKDKNLLYFLVPYKEKFNEVIDIELKDYSDNKVYKFDTKYVNFYLNTPPCTWFYNQIYEESKLLPKQISINIEEKSNIVVNKLVNGEKGNNKYYVGLFENEKDEMTDKIYSIDTIDGIGSIDVPIDNYNKSKNYYIYEVDEKGRKIVNKNVIYNKNKVFETINLVYKYNILSDNQIVSSVFSNSPIEIGKEAGEDYYINNNLVQSNVNEDIVTISSNYGEIVHLVKYETKKDGILDGKLQEVVKDGKRPVDVPNIIANDGYEFDKWVIIKNGEEIEVIPSEYVILEDTTFIAKYRKILQNQDTSDINIWLYVGVAIISIIVIIIITLCINILNKRKM